MLPFDCRLVKTAIIWLILALILVVAFLVRRRRQPPIRGINYEGVGITKYILESGCCRGCANLQITMDAPFRGESAPETLRAKMRAETAMAGYDEQELSRRLHVAFSCIK